MSAEASPIPLFPLGPLFDRLRQAGLSVSTSNVLDIERLLKSERLLDSDLQTAGDHFKIARLPAVIASIIARNAREQEKVIHITTEYMTERLQTEIKESDESEEPDDDDGDPVTPPPPERNWLKTLGTVLVVALVIAYQYRDRIIPQILPPVVTARNTSTGSIVGDTINVFASISTGIRKGDSLEWRIQGRRFITRDTVLRYVASEESKRFGDVRLHRRGRVYTQTFFPAYVACNSISIGGTAGSSFMRGDTASFSAIPGRAAGTEAYTYQWLLNDSLVSTGNTALLRFSKAGDNRLRLIAYTNGACQLRDSFLAEERFLVDSIPKLALTASPLAGKVTTWSKPNMPWSLLPPAVIVLLFIGFIVYTIIANREKRSVDLRNSDTGASEYTDKPYELEFQSRDSYIPEDEYIDELGHLMRRKYESDWQQLNIRKTIARTSRSAGFPTFVYEPRLKPRGFVLLVDQEEQDSHLTRLLSWLVKYLQKLDVHIEVYTFRGRPDKLQNAQGSRISLEKLTELKDERHLIAFCSALCFIDEESIEIRPKLARLLQQWAGKALVTPRALADWAYPEEQLRRSGFIVVPAEIEAVTLMAQAISESTPLTREKLYARIMKSYSPTAYDHYSIAGLKSYLGDEGLFQWICALAVYPRLNWEVTLSLGRAIGVAMEEKTDCNVNLNYNTLLKLSRISWLHDGHLPDSLRLQLLQELSAENHIIARQQIVALCEEKEALLPPNSMAREELETQYTINTFFLYTSDRKKYAHYAGSQDKIAAVWQHILDWPLQELTRKGENKLMPAKGGADQHQSLEEYLSDAAATMPRSYLAGLAVFAALMLFLFMSGWLEEVIPQQRYKEISINVQPDSCYNIAAAPYSIKLSYEAPKGLAQSRPIVRDSMVTFKVPASVESGQVQFSSPGLTARGNVQLNSHLAVALPPCDGNGATAPPLPPGVLPAWLNEIWQGRKNGRLLNINLDRRIIYYSTGDPASYGSYRIEEVLDAGANGYKVITNANPGYNVFFMRPGSNSFQLVACQERYREKATALKAHPDCGPADEMQLYYAAPADSFVLLPILAASGATLRTLTATEAAKINRLLRRKQSSTNQAQQALITYTIQYRHYRNSSFIRTADAQTLKDLLRKAGFSMLEQFALPPASISSPTPFMREGLSVRIGTVRNTGPIIPVDNNLKGLVAQLTTIMPNAQEVRINQFATALDDILELYNINTPNRKAALIALCAFETNQLRYLEALIPSDPKSLMMQAPSAFKDLATAQRYAKDPVATANRMYANKGGNGDEASGDGYRYRGRGLLMWTGKSQYQMLSKLIREDFVSKPDLLSDYSYSLRALCAYWMSRNLNAFADKDDFAAILKTVTGNTSTANYNMAYKYYAAGKQAFRPAPAAAY